VSCSCGIRFVDRLAQIEHMIAARRGVDRVGVPRATVDDALELLESWTVAVRDAIGDQGSLDELAPYWSELADRVVSAARRRAASEIYPERADLFGGLRALAQLADRFQAAAIADGFSAGWRNATVIPSQGGLEVTDVKDWLDLLGAISRHLREARGTVADPSPPAGGAREYPKTTVAEVLAIAEFWTERFGEVERGAIDGLRDAVNAWRRVVGDTIATVQGLEQSATYPKNVEFWRAVNAFVAALDKARRGSVKPTWHVRLGSAVKAAANHVDGTAHAAAQGLPAVIGTAVHKIQSTVQDAAGSLVDRVQSTAQVVAGANAGGAAGAAGAPDHSESGSGFGDTVRALARDAGREAAHAAAGEAKLELRKLARPAAIGGAVVLGALILLRR